MDTGTRALGDPRNPDSLSARFRRRRDVRLRELVDHCAQETGSVRILDMGGTLAYWQRVGIDFLRSRHAKITLLNLQGSELSDLSCYVDIFSNEVGDACRMPQYGALQFDLAHSNSVIEHVQTWANMKAFAGETKRVAKNYYVQTPYFWFPIDPHYYKFPLFHWLPRPTRARLLNALPIAFVGRIDGVDEAFDIVDRARLLDHRQFHFLFSDGEISFERLLGLRKSMIAIRQT